MTAMINRFKTGLKSDRLQLALLIITIPLVVMMGWIFAQPLYSVQIPFQTTPKVLQPSGEAIPGWLTHGNDAGIADKIRNAKRISLFEPTAFKRISRVHQILSAFHSGLSVEDEERLSELIYRESLRYGYDPELIVSVILTESSFYKWAHSRKGAIGLMQINPATGQELSEINRTPLLSAKALYDPHLNVKLGIQYLALLHQRFGDLGLALAAYNHGPTRVAELMDRGERLPPGYTQKILRRYKQLLRENTIAVLPPSTDSPS
jgi:soluble lytic murein transglycosylase